MQQRDLAQPLRTPLSLPELIRIALERNPGLAAARKGIEVAGQRVKGAQGEQFGRLDLRATDTTFGPQSNPVLAQTLVINQAAIGQKQIGVFNANLFGVGGVLSIPLYTGGRITNQIALEQIGVRLATDRLTQSRDGVTFNVASTYYGILKVESLLRATDKSAERLRESKRVVERRFGVGKAAAVDVFKINTRLAAVEQEIIRLGHAREILYGALKTLLGLDATGPNLVIQGELVFLHEAQDLPPAVEEALRRRPDILAKEKQVLMQERQVQIAMAEALPAVALNGSITGYAGDRSEPFNIGFANVSLSMPLFAGGTIRASINQERLRLEELRQELADTKLAVVQEVQAAYLEVQDAAARVKAAEAALAEAREVLRVEQLMVSTGRGMIENLLDAQAAELDAERNLVAALADHHTQKVALKKAIGNMEQT